MAVLTLNLGGAGSNNGACLLQIQKIQLLSIPDKLIALIL